jgi:hypothetical protein
MKTSLTCRTQHDYSAEMNFDLTDDQKAFVQTAQASLPMPNSRQMPPAGMLNITSLWR